MVKALTMDHDGAPATEAVQTRSDGPDTAARGKKRRLKKKEQKRMKKQRKEQAKEDESQQKRCGDDQPQAPKIDEPAADEVKKEIDYLIDYLPIPIPDASSAKDQPKAKALGWFPSARVVKCAPQPPLEAQTSSETPTCSIVLFYQYVTKKHKPWSKQRLNQLLNYLIQIAQTRKIIGGRIRIATEGVNATISSLGPNGVRYLAQDLKNFDPEVFAETDFKYIDDLPVDRHFTSLKILPVQELVYYGFHQAEGVPTEDIAAPLENGGVHLDPKVYHEKLGMENTVVIDVRNHYEAAIGRFDGQMTSAGVRNDGEDDTARGAEYIDPKMRKSTDFAQWVRTPEVQDKLKGKQVLMFCTGGIRCERASAYLKTKLADEIQGVYQLKGGIERYLQTFPDGGYWRGKNFVFDKREAVGADNKAGDGGIVRKKNSNSGSDLETKCCCCGTPWDRYVGKKKCFTCGVPVLMCEKCMSKKPDQTPGMELSVRCPLCVEEGITIPASHVDYTENGVKSKISAGLDGVEEGPEKEKKASTTVLKWGGGHAAKKKYIREMKRKQCRFGSECIRKDCYFAHPEKGGQSSA